MSPRHITVLGECVADAFTEPSGAANELALRVLPGGGPANTTVALARLGTPARFLARLSGDVFGHLFRAHLPPVSGPIWRRPASTCRMP